MDRCHVVLATLFVAKQYHSLPPSIIDVRIRRFAVLVFRPVCSALSYVRYLPFSRGEEMSDTGAFLVSAVGQIEKAHFPDFDNVYCKYAFVSGPDWEIVTVSVLWRYEFACIRGISVRHSSPCLVVWGGWRGESKYAFAFGRPLWNAATYFCGRFGSWRVFESKYPKRFNSNVTRYVSKKSCARCSSFLNRLSLFRK